MAEADDIPTRLAKTSCYDILAYSTKIIVLDTRLLVQKGISALLQHGISIHIDNKKGFHSAPLWDSDAESFAGVLTGT